jgi:hypothetical protein
MNKTNKYKIQETACYSFITLWVLGIILIMATSCTSYEHVCDKYHSPKTTYDCPVFTN